MIKEILISMILWVSFNAPGIAATFTQSSMPSILHDRAVIKVDDDMYVGIKRLPYKDKNYAKDKQSGKSPQIRYDNVYFVFERLTAANYKFWKQFVEEQENKTYRTGAYSDNGTMITINDGIDSFKKSIDMKDRAEKYSIWIAYVTRKDPRVVRHYTF